MSRIHNQSREAEKNLSSVRRQRMLKSEPNANHSPESRAADVSVSFGIKPRLGTQDEEIVVKLKQIPPTTTLPLPFERRRISDKATISLTKKLSIQG